MGRSTFISAALHMAIMLFVIVSFPAARMRPAPLVAIPVDLSTPSDVTKIKAGMGDAKTMRRSPASRRNQSRKP